MSRHRSTRQRLKVTVVSPQGDVSFQDEFRPPDTVSIGRSSESDIVLKDFGDRISRCHAVLLHDGEQWEYYNLGVNGTYEKSRKVDAFVVTSGSVIRLGKRGPIIQFLLRNPGEKFGEGRLSEVLEDESDFSGLGSAVTELITRVRNGDEEAAQLLWDRYANQIVDVARQSLKDSSRRVQDEEDVAVVAFKSLLAGISAGRFPDLDHREQLWRLLMVITTRKAAAAIDRDRRQKRGGGEVRGDSAVMPRESAESGLAGFDVLSSEKPTPDIAAVVADETHQLLSSLPDQLARQIVLLKMEGYTHEEIARKLDCNTRTVERRLKQIREIWQRRLDDEE